MHLLECIVRDIEPEPALRVGLDDVAVFPANRVGPDRLLKGPHDTRGNHTLQQPTHDAADTDVHFHDVQILIRLRGANLESNVIDTDDLTTKSVDDLLIEEVTGDPKHVLIRVVRGELLVTKVDAVERNARHLNETDSQPRGSGAHQKALHTHRIDDRNE